MPRGKAPRAVAAPSRNGGDPHATGEAREAAGLTSRPSVVHKIICGDCGARIASADLKAAYDAHKAAGECH